MSGRMARRRQRLRIVTGRMATTTAWGIVRLRWLIVLGWVAAAVAATLYLPRPSPAQTSEVGTLVPQDAPALQAEVRSFHEFGLPLLSRTAVVQRNPNGLSAEAQSMIYERALALNQHTDPAFRQIAGALPVTNTLRLFPASGEDSTTGITFLFFDPDVPFDQYRTLGEGFAAQIDQPGDSLVGVTGSVPARLRQGDLTQEALPVVEGATVFVVAIIVGLSFLSLGASLATLAAAGLAFAIAVRVVAWVGQRAGIFVPQDLEPVIVVLILGIVTDYAIFFLFGVRDRLRAGQPRLEAAEATTANFLPIIVTAGLTVAAGTASLLASRLQFLRSFGPALALTVVVALLVAVTFIPACLAIFGRALFWPYRPPKPGRTGTPMRAIAPEEPGAGPPPAAAGPPSVRERMVGVTARRPAAFLIALIVLAGLGVAAWQLRGARLGFSLIDGLPHDTEEWQAAHAAALGFTPGILSPTEVLVEGQGVTSQTDALIRLEDLLGRQPDVATVLGPREEQVAQSLIGPALTADSTIGLSLATSGNAARYLLILDEDPLGGRAVDDLRALRDRMGSLVQQAGLTGVRVSLSGDTALATDTVDATLRDLSRIAVVALAVQLLLLILFLRSLIAPLYLLATSVLALLASLGLATLAFQRLFHVGSVTYYVPFATAVLLVSLGSDYNILIVGRMWEEARGRPLREAITVGARRATRPITIAGLTLAATFALLALVPIRPFGEFALTMTVGVLLDSFVVRSFLVPALVSLFGRASFWPGRIPRTAELRVAEEIPAA